jgi:hypothetical protein
VCVYVYVYVYVYIYCASMRPLAHTSHLHTHTHILAGKFVCVQQKVSEIFMEEVRAFPPHTHTHKSTHESHTLGTHTHTLPPFCPTFFLSCWMLCDQSIMCVSFFWCDNMHVYLGFANTRARAHTHTHTHTHTTHTHSLTHLSVTQRPSGLLTTRPFVLDSEVLLFPEKEG